MFLRQKKRAEKCLDEENFHSDDNSYDYRDMEDSRKVIRRFVSDLPAPLGAITYL
jgi:hypothetical protein